VENSLLDANGNYQGGWHYDPIAVADIAAVQPIGNFDDTPAGQDDTPLPAQAFLWTAATKVLGKLLPPRNQGSVGSCVSFGTARAALYSYIFALAMGLSGKALEHFVEEAIYALARHEIGKDRLGFGDGCVGAWAAQAIKDFGVLAPGIYGQYDLTNYDPSRCRTWGRSGLPDDLEPEAKKHPTGAITQIKSWEAAKRCLAGGRAIAVSSSQGFTMTRDKDGFATARGIWRHCMTLCGYQTGRREGGRLDNSWGSDAHSGPVGAGDPGPEGFWADAPILDRMLAEGDSWAFDPVGGFGVQKLSWIL
jgi:hypothetical protein